MNSGFENFEEEELYFKNRDGGGGAGGDHALPVRLEEERGQNLGGCDDDASCAA